MCNILFVLFSFYTISSLVSPESEVGCFKSVEGQKNYMDAYDKAISSSTSTPVVIDVKTSWGIVRVYEWNGDSKGL